MTLRPESAVTAFLTTFALGVLVGGAVADDETTGWSKTALAVLIIFALLVGLATWIACTIDLFWDRGFTT